MKRTFVTAVGRLLKQQKGDLQSTIKFLTQGSRSTTISSLFQEGKADVAHVKHIVDILNTDLPDVDAKRRRIDAHYDLLMSRLKQVVEKSIEHGAQAVNESVPHMAVKDRIAQCQNSDQLYQLLLELQLSRKITRGALAKIVMHKNFTHARQVSENLAAFSYELDLAAMVCYRMRGSEGLAIRNIYKSRWISEWHNLAPLAQKLVWKCEQRSGGLAAVQQMIGSIEGWTRANTIGLFQALYLIAHELPRPEEFADAAQLTTSQHFFIEALRALSPWTAMSDRIRKQCLEVVRASVENRIVSEASSENGVSVNQYRFIRRLDDILQQSVTRNSEPPILQQALQEIIEELHRQEEEVRSQMVLKFI